MNLCKGEKEFLNVLYLTFNLFTCNSGIDQSCFDAGMSEFCTMILDVFTNSSMPFYKFGNLLFLEKIDTDSCVNFIIERFGATSMIISKWHALLIIGFADNHPYYVQQLAQ